MPNAAAEKSRRGLSSGGGFCITEVAGCQDNSHFKGTTEGTSVGLGVRGRRDEEVETTGEVLFLRSPTPGSRDGSSWRKMEAWEHRSCAFSQDGSYGST